MNDAVFPFDISLWNKHALLSCDEMRAAEERAVQSGASYWGLMQRAGREVARLIQERFAPCDLLVLCGAGNNGGDGYVAAEALRAAGWPVRVAALAPAASEDARRAASLYDGDILPLSPDLLEGAALVLDALFGTGLTRDVEGKAAEMLRAIEARKIPVVAVDMPSGISGDTGAMLGFALQATLTITFFRKKRGHALMPGLEKTGETLVADIGIDEEVLSEIGPEVCENSEELWHDFLPQYTRAGHKYDHGHALIFGGAEMTGASRLSARAAQRMGAGLVSLAAPKEAWEVYARALESVIVPRLEKDGDAQALLEEPKHSCLLLGPGLGRDLGRAPENKALILAALKTKKPCVLDADALSIFEDEPEALIEALHEKCILTPHEGEFARLFGTATGKDKITRTQEAARRAGAIILLKGADTVIAAPSGKAALNTNAPPWLATGGAGDVLAGMILGLVSAKMPLFAAACAGAFVHGAVAQKLGQGLIAEDLIAALPLVLSGTPSK